MAAKIHTKSNTKVMKTYPPIHITSTAKRQYAHWHNIIVFKVNAKHAFVKFGIMSNDICSYKKMFYIFPYHVKCRTFCCYFRCYVMDFDSRFVKNVTGRLYQPGNLFFNHPVFNHYNTYLTGHPVVGSSLEIYRNKTIILHNINNLMLSRISHFDYT